MRKRLIHSHRDDGASSSPPWLDLAQLAQVEITSEDPAFPIEAALIPGTHPGWRAAHPGAQVRVAGGEAACLDLIAAGARVRPSASHGRYDP